MTFQAIKYVRWLLFFVIQSFCTSTYCMKNSNKNSDFDLGREFSEVNISDAQKALQDMGVHLPPGFNAKVAYVLIKQGGDLAKFIDTYLETIKQTEILYEQICSDGVKMPITSIEDFIVYEKDFLLRTKVLLDSKDCYDVRKNPVNPPTEFFEALEEIKKLLEYIFEHSATGYSFLNYIQFNFKVLIAHLQAAKNFLETPGPIDLLQDLENTLKLIEYEITIASLRSQIYYKAEKLRGDASQFFKNIITGSQTTFLDFCKRHREIDSVMYTNIKERFADINNLLSFSGNPDFFDIESNFVLETVKEISEEMKRDLH